MSRHTYQLTDATRKTIKDHVQAIAEEMDVSDKYLHGVLAGTETDSFARFLHMYKGTARAGVSRCHWRTAMDAVDAKYDRIAPTATPIDCLTQKITTDADTTQKLVAALKDGRISDAEAEAILQAVQKERGVLDLIETVIHFRRGDLTIKRRAA
jgi:hypothetical protein